MSIKNHGRVIGGAGLVLAACALVGMVLMTSTYLHSKELIRENERQVLLHSISAVLVPGSFNNDVIGDTVTVSSPTWLDTRKPVTIYRARQDGEPVASVLSIVIPDGYNGPIKAIIGINIQGKIIGVRILNHRETPGLGDGIEVKKSDWILSFNKLGLGSLAKSQWRVKKDGGYFDQFTGATITPRAIVKAVHQSLQYFANNKQVIFSEQSEKFDKGQSNGIKKPVS
ncbi:MAG: electron transport complex subunit RsxG [Gammaproteobacteria bacterium]|jgi:electron transport complex protein RnfG